MILTLLTRNSTFGLVYSRNCNFFSQQSKKIRLIDLIVHEILRVAVVSCYPVWFQNWHFFNNSHCCNEAAL